MVSIYRSDDEPEVSTNVSKTVVLNAESEEPTNTTVTKKPKNKKRNKSAAEIQSASHDSTELATLLIAPQKLAKIVTPDSIIELAREKVTEEKVATDNAKMPTPESMQTQKKKPELKPKAKQIKTLPTAGEKKLKPNPNVKLIKPTPIAGPSKFGNIKFDKNFAKKPLPNAKIFESNVLTDERLKAFGINPRRYNWKLKHGNGNEINKKSNAYNNKRLKNNKKFKTPKSPTAPPSKKRKVA